MKIFAYGICKNEIHCIQQAIDCFHDADGIAILDTGSTDGTGELLCQLAAKDSHFIVAQQQFEPFCFDIARNAALQLVPQDVDIVVSFDMDDVFPSDWREQVETAFNEGYTGLVGKYQYFLDGEKRDWTNLDRVAYRNDCRGENPIHEHIHRENENLKHDNDFEVLHYQTSSAAKEQIRRKLYLAAAEEAVKRNLFDPYGWMCLGYEYGNNQEYEKACGAFNMLYGLVKDKETNFLTRKWMKVWAEHEKNFGHGDNYFDIIDKTLKIVNRTSPYEDDVSYDGHIEDEAALEAYYNSGYINYALKYGMRAGRAHIDDARLETNVETYYKRDWRWGSNNGHNDELVIDFCLQHLRADSTILDVGPYFGKGFDLLNPYFANIDAVEAFAPYVEQYDLRDKYRNVFISDILEFDFEHYDCIIMGDILEHLTAEDAQSLLKRIQTKANYIIIIVPYNYEQDEYDENHYQKHLQPDLDYDIFLNRYPEAKVLYSNDYYGIFILGTEV